MTAGSVGVVLGCIFPVGPYAGRRNNSGRTYVILNVGSAYGRETKRGTEMADDQSYLQKDEALLDAEQWERSDEQSLYEACLAFVNAGLEGNNVPGAILSANGKVVVPDFKPGGEEWRAARRELLRITKQYKQSRRTRKQVRDRLLKGGGQRMHPDAG